MLSFADDTNGLCYMAFSASDKGKLNEQENSLSLKPVTGYTKDHAMVSVHNCANEGDKIPHNGLQELNNKNPKCNYDKDDYEGENPNQSPAVWYSLGNLQQTFLGKFR